MCVHTHVKECVGVGVEGGGDTKLKPSLPCVLTDTSWTVPCSFGKGGRGQSEVQVGGWGGRVEFRGEKGIFGGV